MRLDCPNCSARIHVSEPEDDAKVRCPKCGTKFRVPEDEDDDEPRPVKKSGKKRDGDDNDEKKFPVVPVVAGSIAVLVIVGVVVGILMSRSKPDPKPETAAVKPDDANPPPVTPKLVSRPGGGIGGEGGPLPIIQPGGGVGGTPPATAPPKAAPPKIVTPEGFTGPYAELFKKPVESMPPPMIRAASLKPAAADREPEVPTFHSLMLARKEAKSTTPSTVVPKSAKLTPEEVKKACVFIKVETKEGGGTGSGFLISSSGTTGLIATNHHVIEEAVSLKYGASAAKVTVVFNSGTPDEHKHKGQVVAFDAAADVAILKIESTLEWPKPLNPHNTPPKLTEGIPIHFWGFPLGSLLSTGGKKNPEISLGSGSIASFRHAESGKLERVQISGTINPGNSGGPVVDGDGRLVGLVVSTLKLEFGVGIGFAVPVDDLIALLEGKLLTTIFVPTGLEAGKAKFLAFAPIMDPLNKIDTIFVRRWAGDGKPPEVVKDPLTGHKPFAMRKDGKANLPGVDEFALKKFLIDDEDITGLGIALGEMDVPLDADQVLIQVASQTNAHPQTGVKYTAASKPVAYTLDVSDLPVASDARPFAELTANPDALAGRTIIVRARVAAPPNTRDAIQPLVIVDQDGRAPSRMKFLVSREHAVQFDEVVDEHQSLPVRLVCVVGQRDADGNVPVRIARLDFIGRGKRIVRTIPARPADGDSIATPRNSPARRSISRS